MEYRKEVDGLRALAVLPVILNHAKIPPFFGGFVGVDIFFVISGFLISSIIWKDVSNDKFSIVDFYERRARRIIPALVLVILVSCVAAYFTMLPDDLENFAQSVVATLAFSNNILLTLTSGYWELGSDFKPLLHTWSLGVEEQFYLIYPLLVMLLYRFKKQWFGPALIAGIIVSLFLSIWLTPKFPDASFYLIHTRAWELLLGAVCAYYKPRWELSAKGANWASLIGLLFIILSIVGIDEKTPYPSGYAILPCLGTALLLLYAEKGTFANRVLTIPVFVGVGVISYSAYLWHQPLFSFARILSIAPPSMAEMIALSLLTIALSYLSWRFVEQPFRDRKRFSRKQIFTYSALACGTLIVAGLAVYRFSGLPERIPGIGLGQGSYIAYNERVFDYKKDAFPTDGKPRILVLGNSTGRDLTNILLESGNFASATIIYRDDISLCKGDPVTPIGAALLNQADAIVIAANFRVEGRCDGLDTGKYTNANKPLLVVGPKHFGYNLNAYMHTPQADRPTVRALTLAQTFDANAYYRRLAGQARYVDLVAMTDRKFGGFPIFDAKGAILSADRVHVTRAGAIFFAGFIFDNPAWKPVLAAANPGISDRRPQSASEPVAAP